MTSRKCRTGIDAFGAQPTHCHCYEVPSHASSCLDAFPRSVAVFRGRTQS